MKDLIQSSLRDSESIVRGEAVMLIGCLDDRQAFVPSLEEIAKNDPATLPVKADDDADGGILYPVRHHARVVLQDIQNNKTCTR
jgi:hypothetical protein